ncbi:MAG: Na+/H+ antiporter [Nitrospiraceae bacterium]
MENFHQLELVIMLLSVALALTTIAQKIVLPYPILLVLGGLLLALVPEMPTVSLHPDLVFLVFLPPILWSAAYFTSWREFRANLRPISLLAVGLVLATTIGVAMMARWLLPGMGWPEALALGAIVSPPDAVSATAIGKRLRIPRRIVTILEGESLVNDASALVLYRAAVAAAIGNGFDLGTTLLHFVLATVGGIAIGMLVSMAARWAMCAARDSFTEIAITLLSPYVAWVIGESVHASAVLACVAGGLSMRKHFSEFSPMTRIHGRAVWDVLIFVLNGFIFILIGLELTALRETIPADRFGPLLVAGALVSVTAIVVRLIWVPLAAAIPRWPSPSIRRRDPLPPWQNILVASWTGMRGIVTLAAALALPIATDSGSPFPFRSEIILISFCVILTTLVGQGLTLSPLIRALRLHDDHGLEQEEMLARRQAAEEGLQRLEQLAGEPWTKEPHIEQLRAHYGDRVQRFGERSTVDQECSEEMTAMFRRLRHETMSAERLHLIALRNSGTISDEVLHRLEHELDVEAIRLGIGEQRIMAKHVSP